MKEFKSHAAILADQVILNAGVQYDPDSHFFKSSGPANPDTPEDQQRRIVVGFTLNGVPLECSAIYTRLQIEEVLASKSIPRLVIRGDQQTREDVIAILREQLGVNIIDADVLDVEPAEEMWMIRAIEFGAHQDSLMYQGSLNATFLTPFPDQTGPILVSLPGVDISEPERMDYAHYFNNPLSKAELRPNTQLIRKGAGPNGGFTVVSNGELSLSLKALYQGDDTLPPITDNMDEPINKGIYVLEKPVGNAWNSVFSISMEGGVPITDAYDIFIAASAQVEGGETAFWKLVRNGNRLEIVPHDNRLGRTGGPITEVSGSLTVCQGIIDPKNLLTTLGLTEATGNGMYVVQLLAYRKNTVVEPFKAQIMVHLKPAVVEPAQQEQQEEQQSE